MMLTLLGCVRATILIRIIIDPIISFITDYQVRFLIKWIASQTSSLKTRVQSRSEPNLFASSKIDENFCLGVILCEKHDSDIIFLWKFTELGGIRTPGPVVRSHMLWSTELQALQETWIENWKSFSNFFPINEIIKNQTSFSFFSSNI